MKNADTTTIKILDREIDQLYLSEAITFYELSEYLQQIFKRNEKQADFSKWLRKYLEIIEDEDGEYKFKGILEDGALAILKDMQYIESVNNSHHRQ